MIKLFYTAAYIITADFTNERFNDMTEFGNTKNERRERVFQMLFSLDFNKDRSVDDSFASFFDENDTMPGEGYLRNTLCGAYSYISEADNLIEADSKNWSTDRMSGVTRSILRLGIYELLCTELPPKVAISEAVELAKKFGDDQEPAFINGILNRIARQQGKL